MKPKVKVVIVIPVGPLGSSYTLDQLYDTVESVIHYADPSRMIVIQDSSAPLYIGKKVRDKFPEVVVNFSPENYGAFGGVFKADALAFSAIHNFFDYQLLVRMDIEALWTGRGLEDDVIQFFADNPKVGILANAPDSRQKDDFPRRMMVRQGKSLWGLISNSKRFFMLRRLMQGAQGNGWKIGDHALGGVMIFNPALIGKLIEQRMLLREEIRTLTLKENHIYSLLCRFAGMELNDFGLESSPMSDGRGPFPMTPQEVVHRNNRLIHSVRQWKQVPEDQARAFFRTRRQESTIPVRD